MNYSKFSGHINTVYAYISPISSLIRNIAIVNTIAYMVTFKSFCISCIAIMLFVTVSGKKLGYLLVANLFSIRKYATGRILILLAKSEAKLSDFKSPIFISATFNYFASYTK